MIDMTVNDDSPRSGEGVPETLCSGPSAAIHPRTGHIRSFAVLAEEGSGDEAEPELMPQRRRRRVVSPSVPPTQEGPVRPTHGKLTWSPVSVRQRPTLNLFSQRPEVKRLPRWRVTNRFCASTCSQTISAHPVRVNTLDTMNVREVIAVKACVMKVPPALLRGAYRSTMRLPLQEIVSGMELQNQLRISRVGNCSSYFQECCYSDSHEEAPRSSAQVCERRVG